MHNSEVGVKARRVVLAGDEGVIDCLGLVRDGQTPEGFVIRLFEVKLSRIRVCKRHVKID